MNSGLPPNKALQLRLTALALIGEGDSSHE